MRHVPLIGGPLDGEVFDVQANAPSDIALPIIFPAPHRAAMKAHYRLRYRLNDVAGLRISGLVYEHVTSTTLADAVLTGPNRLRWSVRRNGMLFYVALAALATHDTVRTVRKYIAVAIGLDT